jgi:hypothetical protein
MQRAVLRFSVDVLLIYSVVLEPEGKKKEKKEKRPTPKINKKTKRGESVVDE